MKETDYLIVGAGAMGMAFADTILNETEEATVTIVDKHARPGGHWNDAYPFVRLHQPSAFYGVNSRPLGDDRIDVVGWNAGMYELASGAEVLTYYDHLMHRDFLPSGRVRYVPMSEYDPASDDIVSLTTGERTTIDAATLVDASYMKVSVPSQRPPSYAVADGVHCAPLNDLPNIARPADGYVRNWCRQDWRRCLPLAAQERRRSRRHSLGHAARLVVHRSGGNPARPVLRTYRRTLHRSISPYCRVGLDR